MARKHHDLVDVYSTLEDGNGENGHTFRLETYPNSGFRFRHVYHPEYYEKEKILVDLLITPSPVGIAIEAQGENVCTLKGQITMGKYPVRTSIPGEASPERMGHAIHDFFENCLVVDNTNFHAYIQPHIDKVIEQRGHIDEKGELPEGFCEELPSRFLFTGQKNVAGWQRGTWVKIFFDSSIGIQPLTPEQERTTLANVVKRGISTTQADRDIHRDSRLNEWSKTKDNVSTLIENKILPEKIYGLKHYKKYLSDLDTIVISGLTRSPHFNAFLSQSYDTFGKSIKNHIEHFSGWPEIKEQEEHVARRDTLLKAINSWPKTEAMATAFEEALNAGIPPILIVQRGIKTPKALHELLDLAREARQFDKDGQYLNENFKKLPISLDEGWAEADHLTFPLLSKEMSCCISEGLTYESPMVNGKARTFYRIDKMDNPNGCGHDGNGRRFEYGLGAVAYIEKERHSDSWILTQIRAFANQNPHPRFVEDARRIAQTISREFPGQHAVVEQVNVAESKSKIIDTYNEQLHAIQDLPNEPYHRDHLDRIAKAYSDKANTMTQGATR